MFLTLIGLIPGLLSAWTTWQKNKFDAQVQIIQAKTGADKAAAVELAKTAAVEAHESTARLSVIAGSSVLLTIVVGLAAPLVIYEWKIIVVDIVIGPGHFLLWSWDGNTDPIRGQVADWATTIIAGVLGSTTSLALGHMYFNRKQ